MTCEECGSPKASQRGEGPEMVILCDPCWDEEQPTEEELNLFRQIVLETAREMGIKSH